ncbi:MFS transporter [Paraburkholderia sp. CNPSo 3155]|uniref:MFS transporter n=1 Tax=Paraburkholderia atlantica TaxID=2654982 RepID=UPI00128B6FCB|nr:MFS transporter [Paraburkholderia atlantica]MBB5419627.1 EmrB/QacA subfamily drug resistance transporter [Paraburkholderia atlantica]MPW10309.1 MFS transporter [Paraburkholderia atlantica]
MKSEAIKSAPAAFGGSASCAASAAGAVTGPGPAMAGMAVAAKAAAPGFPRQALALAVLFVGAFLAPLDYFIVNLALPSIHTGLNASDAQLQLVVSAYASAYAVLLITGGRLGDLFGRRRMFMTGMAAFVIASALCGFATSGHMLVIARIVQGIAAAVMAPQVLATIRAVVPLHQQTRVMSLYGFVFGLSSIVGQLGGGALITYHPFGLDWRVIFLINIPIGIAAFIGTWKFVPENQPATHTGVDLKGVALLSAVLLLVIYPMTHGREAGWPAWTFVMFALAVPVFALFVATELRVERGGGHPLVDLQLFRNRAFALGLVLAFLFYCNSAFFLTYGIFLQTGLHWTPLASGIAIMPFAVGFVIGPLTSPAVVKRIGAHVLTLGFSMMTLGFTVTGWSATRSATPDLLFYSGLVCAGVGHGLLLPSIMRIVLQEVVPEKAGLASGVVSSTLQIGSAFGTAAVSGAFFGALGGSAAPASYAHAFQLSLAINAALMFVCIGLSVLLVRHQQSVRRSVAPAV